MQPTHVAWVTSPGNETPQRVEVRATDRAHCLRQVLRTAPAGARASCRPVDHTSFILASLAIRASAFPLVVPA